MFLFIGGGLGDGTEAIPWRVKYKFYGQWVECAYTSICTKFTTQTKHDWNRTTTPRLCSPQTSQYPETSIPAHYLSVLFVIMLLKCNVPLTGPIPYSWRPSRIAICRPPPIMKGNYFIIQTHFTFSRRFAYRSCEAHSLACPYTRRKATRFY